MSRKQSPFQVVVLVFLALGTIVLSIVSTLAVRDLVMGTGDSSAGAGKLYRQISIVDAELVCKNEARDVIGSRLHAVSVDDFSSRYDEPAQRYRIFLEASLYAPDQRSGGTSRHFISCYTRSDRPQVVLFDLSEEGEVKSRVIRKREEGGAFGIAFPK